MALHMIYDVIMPSRCLQFFSCFRQVRGLYYFVHKYILKHVYNLVLDSRAEIGKETLAIMKITMKPAHMDWPGFKQMLNLL